MFTPVIIGVGDVKNRSTKVEDAIEPMWLMLEAIKTAIKDANFTSNAVFLDLQSQIDSIDVVKTWTWPYADLPGLLAEKLGLGDGVKHKFYSEHGGNHPAKLLDEAAKRISRGEAKVAVVTGGEALASLTACAAAKQLPPPGWTSPETAVTNVFSPTGRDLGATQASQTFTLNHYIPAVDPILMSAADLGARHQIGAPIHVYPLYENGFRAHRGQSVEENHAESTSMYAEFAKIAAENEVAWNYGHVESEETIGRVEGKNRMICFPYPLLMNAFNTVNLAAAVLLTSTENAAKLGIPKDRWIYPLAGAGTQDSPNFWERPNFYTSPSLSRSIDAALDLAGLTTDQIDYFDFYSCFPIVPKLACQHLGLSITKPEKPITLLGGLTFFGGAGNNYSMHSMTAMVRKLRERPSLPSNSQAASQSGLILANGGFATYQHVVIFSTHPSSNSPSSSPSPYPQQNPLPHLITDIPAPEVVEEVGPTPREAQIETCTVEFSRDGKAQRGHVVGRLLKREVRGGDPLAHGGFGGSREKKRFLANHADETTLGQLSSWEVEPVGQRGWVWTIEEGGAGAGDGRKARRNVFSFEKPTGIGTQGRGDAKL